MALSVEKVEGWGFEVVRDRCTREEIVIICQTQGCGDRSGNRGISIKSGKTNCWRCGKGGDFIKWARSLGHVIEEDEVNVAVEDIPEALNSLLKASNKISPAYVADVKLPSGFVSLCDEPDCGYAKLIAKMAKRKNLELEDFIRAGVGFTRLDSYWEPYAIFPVWEWGKVVYYQGRLYSKDKEVEMGMSKKFPSKKIVPLGSRHWLYNIDKLRAKGHTAIIVESILNVISLEKELKARKIKGVIPVAIFKHKISREQAKKLAALRNVKEFCLMFDSDAIGSAWDAVRKVGINGKLSVAEMPEGVDANDDAVIAVDQFFKRKSGNGSAGMLAQCEALLNGL